MLVIVDADICIDACRLQRELNGRIRIGIVEECEFDVLLHIAVVRVLARQYAWKIAAAIDEEFHLVAIGIGIEMDEVSFVSLQVQDDGSLRISTIHLIERSSLAVCDKERAGSCVIVHRERVETGNLRPEGNRLV